MRILFLVLVGIFQLLGCLQPVQEVVQMVMSTGLVKDPQAVFICLALAIVVFAALIKFVPGFAQPFQTFESKLLSFRFGTANTAPAAELAAQVQSLAAEVAQIKQLIVPGQGATQNPATLDALATGEAPAAPAAGGTA